MKKYIQYIHICKLDCSLSILKTVILKKTCLISNIVNIKFGGEMHENVRVAILTFLFLFFLNFWQ